MKTILTCFKWFVLAGFLGLAFTLAAFLWVREEAKPYLARFDELEILLNPITVHAADGRVVAHLRPFQGRLVDRNDWIELEEIPAQTQQALILLEDASSDYHFGVDLRGVIRAVLKNLLGSREGASTLECQVIRNIFDGTYRPYGEGEPLPKLKGLREGGFAEYQRKLLEYYLATLFSLRFIDASASDLEDRKNKILLSYFNLCHFCPERRGINYACRRYLGKNPDELDPLQSIFLARTPNRPVWITDPSCWREVVENAARDLARNKRINNIPEDYTISESYEFPRGPAFGGLVPRTNSEAFYHAVKEAAWWLDQLDKTGIEVPPGSHVFLTIEADLQIAVHEAVKSLPSNSEAAVVIQSSDGQIKALVGGKSSHGSCRATTVRIKGWDSTLKPFIALSAISDGAIGGGDSKVPDRPIYGTWPRNFGRGWSGEVTLKEALIRSLNPWAVQYGQICREKLRETLLNLEVPFPTTPVEYLGTGPSGSLVNVTAAYSIFLNNGFRVKPTIIMSIYGADEQLLFRHSPEMVHISDRKPIEAVMEMLQQVVENPRGTAHALDDILNEPLAAKTGSSATQRRLQLLLPESKLSIGIHVMTDDGSELPSVAKDKAFSIARQILPRVVESNASGAMDLTQNPD